MELKYTTPVPNGLFERMGELNGTELKALLFIIRKTLGWKDASTGKRKERDWISHSQFVEHAGISDRSVTSAIQGLLEKNLITTTNREGQHLLYPKDRQKCPQVFYGLSVSITEKPAYIPAKNLQNSPQRLRATKETLQNSRKQELPMFSQREKIEREEERMQYKRNRWGY